MRPVKFRGRSIHGELGKWVFGVPIFNEKERTVVIVSDGFETVVIPETVGQFLGLTGKGKKEIWEDSIVQMKELSGYDEVKEKQTFKKTIWRVRWEKDRWHLFNAKGERWDNGYTYEDYDDTVGWKNLKVIGDFYDNPELIK